MNPVTNEQFILQQADRCVKCGLCLPQCPSYQLHADENDSPRGRIALIEGLLKGLLTADNKLQQHIDRCLMCRRCERVCPSGVRFGELMDHSRALLPVKHSLSRRIFERRHLNRVLTRAGQTLPNWPFHRSRISRMQQLSKTALGKTTSTRYPVAATQQRGVIGLFTGCIHSTRQDNLARAASYLLNAVGYDVRIPAQQRCCGALAAHAGEAGTAQALQEHNRSIFASPLDMTISMGTGCGIHLDSYQPALPAPHIDISDFLLQQLQDRPLTFAALSARVLLHTPCSLENVARGGHWAPQLLRYIPGLSVALLGNPGQCCGAAGEFALNHPDDARRLRSPLLQQIRAESPAIILSSNIGCVLHLLDGLSQQPHDFEIMHPIELLARQLVYTD